MMEILQTDYIKFARARGINEKSINYKHALKNGLIPVITIAGINIGTLIAFSIITETVFQWPGMGFLFMPVYTPNKVPETNAIRADIKTNSIVAGNLSMINSDTGLLN